MSSEMVQGSVLDLLVTCGHFSREPSAALASGNGLRGNDNAWIELNIQLLQVGTCSYHAVCSDAWGCKCKGTFYCTIQYKKVVILFGYHHDTIIFVRIFRNKTDNHTRIEMTCSLFQPGNGAWTPRNTFGS